MSELQPNLQPDAENASAETAGAAPSGELPAAEPELFEQAKAAIAAIRGRGRQQDGRAAAGNTLNLRHGLRSQRLLDVPDIAVWHREQVEAITTDLGGEAELSVLARATVREAARLEVIVAALGDELLAGGVLTGKGKTRSATRVYLQALDRFAKLTGTLGLRRVPRRVETFAAAIAQEPARE